jgi:hypothetical protein
MGEQADGHTEGRPRFTDRGQRFTRRGFLGKAGLAGLAVGTGAVLTGCQFNTGPNNGVEVGDSSTAGQSGTSTKSNGGGGSGSSSS